jgi:hypothetical protein
MKMGTRPIIAQSVWDGRCTLQGFGTYSSRLPIPAFVKNVGTQVLQTAEIMNASQYGFPTQDLLEKSTKEEVVELIADRGA